MNGRPNVVVLLGLTFALMLTGVLVGSSGRVDAVSAPTVVETKMNYSGADYTSLTVDSGTEVIFYANYSCPDNGNSDLCLSPEIVVTVPAELSVSQNSAVCSACSTPPSENSGDWTFTLNDLSSGATGQVELRFFHPPYTTPDGTSSTVTTAEGSGSGSSISFTQGSVTLNATAASSTSMVVTKTSGGAAGSAAAYGVSMCLVDDISAGPLGSQAGGSLVVTYPSTYTVDSSTISTGGVLDAVNHTITWTTAAHSTYAYCMGVSFGGTYPDPPNQAGDSVTISGVWTGALVGEVGTRQLAAESLTHNLEPPSAGGGISKGISGGLTTATPGDTRTYLVSISNSGSADWTDATVNDEIPDAIDINVLAVDNPSRAGVAELWIISEFGADGVDGNADDPDLFKIDEVAANASLSINPYTTAPSVLGRVLVSGDTILEVETRVLGTISAGTSATVMSLTGTVLGTTRSGQILSDGDTVVNAVSGVANHADGSVSLASNVEFTIQTPTPFVAVRHGAAPATLQPGQRNVSHNITFDAGNPGAGTNDDIVDPVFAMLLPKFVELDAWTFTANASGLPTPTLDQVDDFGGVPGQTLLRWTVPSGSRFAEATGVRFDIDVVYGPGSKGTMSSMAWMSAANRPLNCDFNFWPAADTYDIDEDGNTSEGLCNWGGSVALVDFVEASVAAAVKGSWDAGFVAGPSTGYSAPGSDDDFRLSVQNTGTVDLTDVVLVDVLPRPGDTKTINSTARTPATSTFPVMLRTAPTVPAGLDHPVGVFYSVAANPCRPDLNFSPAGCAAPVWTDWGASPPSTIGDVTALKFDFGQNLLVPGTTWAINLGVTTPSTGATEPDFAVVNPTTTAADDEVAYNSVGFVLTRNDTSSQLSPSESSNVALRMPSIFGPPTGAPVVSALTSTGAEGASQTVTPTVPPSGTLSLLDGGTEVTTVTVPSVGTYTVTNGSIVFTPVSGYVGTPPAVEYRVTNVFGNSSDEEYTPTVTAAPVTTTTTTSTTTTTTTTTPIPATTSTVAATTTLVPATTTTTTIPIQLPPAPAELPEEELVPVEELVPSEPVVVEAGGFEPEEPVGVYVATEESVRAIAAVTADESGDIVAEVTVPPENCGDIDLVVWAPGSGIGFRQGLTITGCTLPQAGRGPALPAVAIGLVLLGLIVLLRRPQPERR